MVPNEFDPGEPDKAEDVSEADIERQLDEIIEERISKAKPSVDTLAEQLREKLQYRLMGMDVDGAPIPWEKDVKHVRDLERALVIDPEQVRREFAEIRSLRQKLQDEGKLSAIEIGDRVRAESFKIASFSREGGHVHLNTADTLYRVRREGWVILAGIYDARRRFHTIATNYGLSCMPEDDEEFLLLSKSTLVADEHDKVDMASERISFNWRTSIARSIRADLLRSADIEVPKGQNVISTRRIGVASMLKYIMTRMAQLRGKDAVYFNIATLLDVQSGSNEKILNAPSFFHNKRYFEDTHGHRSIRSDIVEKLPLGERNKTAKAKWKTYGDRANDAMVNLKSEQSVLVTRGIDMDRLEIDAERLAHQMDNS